LSCRHYTEEASRWLPPNNKKILKKDTSIVNEKTISLVFVLMIEDKLLTGIKPPDEINVIAKLNESKDLRSKIFKIRNIKNVNKI
jgi:hypothetical protein